MSWTHLLISKISHVCQEICDIKGRREPKSNLANQNYTNTGLDEGQTDRNYTWELDSNSSAKEGSDGEDGWGEICSSHSRICHHEPNKPDIPSHHASIPPSLNPPLSESTLEPPGDLSPSPVSRIVTLIPSLPRKLERKACSAALSLSVHISPSSPCAAWNVLLSTQNRLGEESSKESVMEEESLLVMGERGGGPGVGGLHPRQGRGTGMVTDREGGAKADCTQSGIGSPSPLQAQQRESWRDMMMAWRGTQCSLVKWSKAASRAANFTNFPYKLITRRWRLSISWLLTLTLPPSRERSRSMESQVKF